MRKIIITLIWSFAALYSFAQQAPAKIQTFNFSLADCINYAYEHQDSIVNAKLDITTAELKVKETVAQGLPQVNAVGQFQDYFKTPTQVAPGDAFGRPGQLIELSFALKYSSSLAVSASQLLFDGTFLVGLKAVKTYKELSQRSLTRTKIDVNVNVSKAYYQVLVSGEQIKLLEANVKQLQQQLHETTEQNKQGFVEKIDVDRLTVQYNNLVTTRDNTVRLLALNLYLLKYQMGMPIESDLTLQGRIEDVSFDDNIAEASTDTTFYHNRVEYTLLETAKKLNELDLMSRKAEYLPSLSATGGYTANYYENKFSGLYKNNLPFSFIGLRLNIPIFDGGARKTRVGAAKIAIEKSNNNLVGVKDALTLQAKSVRITYVNGVQSLNNQRANQKLAQEVLRVSQIKYKQGVGSSIEVTQAETALEDANNKYIQGLYDALVSKVDLDKAYGRIK